MNYIKRIKIKYQKNGFWELICYFLNKVGIKAGFKFSLINKKILLYKKIYKISKNKVVDGLYKSLILPENYNWNKGNTDLTAKLLGCYEEQVQEKIVEIKKKYNLKYLIVFGAGEGFHALGLMKKKIFYKAYLFEKDAITRNILIKNAKINRIKNINIFTNANFSIMDNFLEKKLQKKTLYLVDIEGEEFNLFNKKNLNYYKFSHLIVENHENFIKNSKLKNKFFKLINNNFNITYLNNGSRNPFKFKKLDFLNDDERWLIMSENRPYKMNWLILNPKSN